MVSFCLSTGRAGFARAVLAALLPTTMFAAAAEQFPFDRELVLDAAPIRPGKHMPMLTVMPNGDATIELWCKTVSAHVEVSDASIKFETQPLPDALPETMGRDQCTSARMEADSDLLAAIARTTEWRTQGSGLVLVGPKTLEFRANDH